MLKQIFSKKEALNFGWQKIKENFLVFLPILLVYFILVILLKYSYAYFLLDYWVFSQDHIPFLVKYSYYLIVILGWIISLSFFKLSLKIADGQKPVFKDIFYSCKIFYKYFIIGVLFLIISTAVNYGIDYLYSSTYEFYKTFGLGLTARIILENLLQIIWFIISIFLFIKLMFYPWFIIDGQGLIKSLKSSWQITKNIKGSLFAFDLLLVLINILGVLVAGIGLLWTVPLSLIALAYIFRKLQIKPESEIIF